MGKAEIKQTKKIIGLNGVSFQLRIDEVAPWCSGSQEVKRGNGAVT